MAQRQGLRGAPRAVPDDVAQALLPRARATSQQLRVFAAVARLGSFARAAEALHLAPPTVSLQMKELAAQIGEPLLDAQGRRLVLTPAGDAVLDAAVRMADAWTELQERLAALRGLERGRITIAAVTTAEYFLPRLIGPFAARHPGIEFTLHVENRDRVVERLQGRSVDLAVMMLPPEDADLQVAPFLDNPLVVVSPDDSPLARRRRLTLASLAEEAWLVREPGSGTRQVAEAHFRAQRFAPRVRMELGSNEAIRRGVAAGLGLAVVSRHVLPARPADDGLAVLRVEGFPLARRWQMVHPASMRLPAAAIAFLEHLKLSLRDFGI